MKSTKLNIIPQCIAVGIIFQLLLTMFCAIGFSTITFPTPTRYTLVVACAMAVLTAGALLTIKLNNAKFYARPTRFKVDMIVLGVVLLAAIGATVIYRCENNVQKSLLLLVTLFMPLYEGVVFRGLMWHKLKKKLNSKLGAWASMILIATIGQLFYTYEIYQIMLTSGDILADPGNIAMGVACYGVVVNAITGGIRVGVHNFTFPAIVHSAINFALMFFVVL